MPNVYFAKFNFNGKIYEIYSNEEKRQELLNKLYNGLNTDVKLLDEKSGKNFKFIHLDKDPDKCIVKGRVVLYAPGVHISYDEQEDDVVETKDDNKASYITFCFDINKEIIGFVPKNDFKRKMFMEKLTQLIEACCDVGEVAIFLETDLKKLQERLEIFTHVKEVSVLAVPPNGDKEDYENLMGSNASLIQDTGATKYQMRFIGTVKKGIDANSPYIRKWISVVTRGYGEMSVYGKSNEKENVTISSKEDAPFFRPIGEVSKDSIPEVAEKTRAGISELMVLKVQSEVMMKDEHPNAGKDRT